MSRVSKTEEISETVQPLRRICEAVEDYSPEHPMVTFCRKG